MDLSKRRWSFVELARSVAMQSQVQNFWHGAVLVRGGRVVNTSPNKPHYSSFASRFRKSRKFFTNLHAEVGAVLGVDKAVTNGATVYVVRVGRGGELRNSKPCAVCMAILGFCGVKKVFHSNDDGSVDCIKL